MMEPREPQRDRDARPASRPPARLAGMVGLAAVAVALAAGPALAWPPSSRPNQHPRRPPRSTARRRTPG